MNCNIQLQPHGGFLQASITIFVVLVGLDLRSDLKSGIDNNLTCIHPNLCFRSSVPQHVSHGSEHSDPLPMLRPPTSEHTDPHPIHRSLPLRSRTLGSLTTGPEHMDLSKSFAAATEDSWMIISLYTIRESMLSMQVKSPQSPKGLLLNKVFQNQSLYCFFIRTKLQDFKSVSPSGASIGKPPYW